MDEDRTDNFRYYGLRKAVPLKAEGFGMTDGLGTRARLLTLGTSVTFAFEGILL